MTTIDPNWVDHLARKFYRPHSTFRNLIKAGKIPPSGAEFDLSNPNDLARFRQIGTCLSGQNTPATPFINELRSLAHVQPFELPFIAALAGFQQLTLDPSPTAAYYAMTRFRQPWRGHRVPVSRVELDTAGYPAFAALWTTEDPYRSVSIDGEIYLGPNDWLRFMQGHEELRVFRSQFLNALADVIEQRPAAGEVLQ